MDNVSLVPVDYQPDFENVSLVPVDHDPFAGTGIAPPAPLPIQPTETAQVQNLAALGQQTQDQPSQSQPAQAVPQTRPQQPVTAGASDFFQSIPRGIVSGFNSAASALGQATQIEMGQDVDVPSAEQSTKILEQEVFGPMHRPEGRAGRFGASVGEFLGNPASYLARGSLPFKVGAAVLGGLGSEAGGQLGEGTPWELPLRIAGGALGFGAPSAARLGTAARSAETLPAESQAAGRAAGVTAKDTAPAAAEEAGALNAPDGKFYSVLYGMKLKPTSYPGFGRPAHFQEANEALLQEMEGDGAYARDMENQGVNLQRTPTGLAPRTSPSGFTWHHQPNEPGVMQLVPGQQHRWGSIFQDVLHPDGKGGFARWGK